MGDQAPVRSEATRRPRRFLRAVLKWAFRIASSILIIVLALLLCLPYITDTRAVKGLVARKIAARLSDAEVRIETLRLAPLSNHLLLMEGLVLAPRGRPHAPVVSIGRVDCWWVPARLLKGQAHLTELSVESVRVELRRESGRWNFLSIFPKERRPLRLENLRLPLALRMDAARASNALLTLDMEGKLMAAVGPVSAEWSCDLKGLLAGAADLRVSARRAEVARPPFRLILPEGFDARAAARNPGALAQLSGTLVVNSLQAELPGFPNAAERVPPTSANGNTPAPGGPHSVVAAPLSVGASFSADLDLARLEIPRADFDLQVPGLLTDSLSLSLKNGAGWNLAGRNLFAADVGSFAEALPLRGLKMLRSATASGQVFAATDIAGRLAPASPLRAAVRLSTRATASGVAGHAEVALPAPESAALPAGESVVAVADIAGLDATRAQDVEIFLGGGLGGWAVTDLSCSLDSVKAAVPGLIDAEGGPFRARLSAVVSLPTARAARLRGSLADGIVTVRSSKFGQVSLPVELAAAISASDPLDLAAGRNSLDDLSGSVGNLIPHFRLSASAVGLGREKLEAEGEAALDLGALVGLLSGLDEGLRAKLGELQLAGAATGAFELDGTVSGPGAGGRGTGLRLTADGSALLTGLALRRGAVEASLGQVKSSGALDLSMDSHFLPYNLRLSASASGRDFAASLAAAQPDAPPAFAVSLAGLDARLSGEVPGPDLRLVNGRAEASVQDLVASLARGPEEGAVASFGPFSFKGRGRLDADPLAGDAQLSDAALEAPGLLELAAPSIGIEGFGGDAVSGRVQASLPDLSALVRAAAPALPPALASKLAVTGHAAGEVQLGGRLPLAEQIVAALEGGRALPRPEFFPLKAFYERQVPFTLDGRLNCQDVAASWKLSPDLTVGISGVAGEGRLSLKPGGAAAGSLVAGSVGLTVGTVDFPPSPVPLKDFRLGADFALRDFDQFDLTNCTFAGLGRVLEASATVHGSGLSRLSGVPTPGAVLENVDLTVQSSGKVRLGEMPAVEGLKCSGEASCDLNLAIVAGDRVTLALSPRLDNVSVAFRDLFALDGLGGNFGLAQDWRIVSAEETAAAPLSQSMIPQPAPPTPSAIRPTLPEFGTAADALIPPDQALTLRSASLLGKPLVSNLTARIETGGSALSVPGIYLQPLGGELVGSASFLPLPAAGAPVGSGRELQVEGEFAGVDLRLLLPPDLRDFSGDSQIDGSFMLGAVISPPPAGELAYNPLKDVMARLNVTHIGAEALDHLLLGLDPRAANPSIARARQALGFAAPVSVSGSLERAFAAADVQLQGLASNLVTDYDIPRFNVAQLFGAKLVTDIFRKAAPILSALNLLDADRLEVSPDGSVRLR